MKVSEARRRLTYRKEGKDSGHPPKKVGSKSEGENRWNIARDSIIPLVTVLSWLSRHSGKDR